MIITVASFKGGVGKTTSAIHLAAFFQGQAKTLLIDADPNRSALGWASRGELPFPVLSTDDASRQAEAYEHLIIDTQARPNAEELKRLADSCDLLVLPTLTDIMSLDALVLTIEYLQAIQVERYRILITAIPPKPSKVGQEVKDMLEENNLPVFDRGIRRYSAFQKAAMNGLPVYAVKDAKAESAWQDYETVGEEILVLMAGLNR